MVPVGKHFILIGRIKREGFSTGGMELQIRDELGHAHLVWNVCVRGKLVKLMRRFPQAVSTPRFTAVTKDTSSGMPLDSDGNFPLRIVRDLDRTRGALNIKAAIFLRRL